MPDAIVLEHGIFLEIFLGTKQSSACHEHGKPSRVYSRDGRATVTVEVWALNGGERHRVFDIGVCGNLSVLTEPETGVQHIINMYASCLGIAVSGATFLARMDCV